MEPAWTLFPCLFRLSQVMRNQEGCPISPRSLGNLPSECVQSGDQEPANRFVAIPLCLSVSVSLCLFVSLSLCFSVSLALCLSVSLPLCLSVSLPLCLALSFLSLSVFLFLSLPLVLSLFLFFTSHTPLALSLFRRGLCGRASAAAPLRALLPSSRPGPPSLGLLSGRGGCHGAQRGSTSWPFPHGNKTRFGHGKATFPAFSDLRPPTSDLRHLLGPFVDGCSETQSGGTLSSQVCRISSGRRWPSSLLLFGTGRGL